MNAIPSTRMSGEEESKPRPSKGWAEMIRRVYEVAALFIL
jgi:hypothetical protein